MWNLSGWLNKFFGRPHKLKGIVASRGIGKICSVETQRTLTPKHFDHRYLQVLRITCSPCPTGEMAGFRRKIEGINEVVPTVGCTVLGTGPGCLRCFWNLLDLALLPLTALLESHWATSGQRCSREYPVPDGPLLHHPEPNNWLSLSLVLTICPSGGFLWSAASQWLTDCLRSRYSSILITKLLPYPIGLGKVHMLTLLSARLSCHATWIYYVMRGQRVSLRLLKFIMEFFRDVYIL